MIAGTGCSLPMRCAPLLPPHPGLLRRAAAAVRRQAGPLLNFMFPFHKLDADHDGALSLGEFQQIAAASLTNLDREKVQQSHDEGVALFSALDVDGDGRLDAREHFAYQSGVYAAVAALRNLFELADSDADGKLTTVELVACREHPRFPGSAAFHHSKDWIDQVEEAVRRVEAQAQAQARVQARETRAQEVGSPRWLGQKTEL